MESRQLTLSNHSGRKSLIAASKNYFLSVSDGTTIRFCDLNDFIEFYSLNLHSFSIPTFAISQDNHYIPIATSANILKIWNMETKKEQLSMDFSSEGLT